MVEAVVPVLLCRCGAPMSGPANGGRPWSCEKNHQFRVTSTGGSVCAIALRGDRAAGVDMNRTYLWRPTSDGVPTRPSPR